MTSSNTLKKFVSIGAAMLLAVGGSLVAAQPASAAATAQLGQAAYPNIAALSWSAGSSSANLLEARFIADSTISSVAKFSVKMSNANGTITPNIGTGGADLVNNCKINYTYKAPAAGTYSAANGLSGSCSVSNGAVIYTVSTPGGPFSLASTDMLKIQWTTGAWDPGALAGGTYNIDINLMDSSNVSLGTATNTFTLAAPTVATLDANGGTLGGVTTVAPDMANQIHLPRASQTSSAPTKTGMALIGWSTNQSATTGAFDFTLTSAATYYAIWGTPTLYTVTFNADGGTVTSGSLTATQASAGGLVTVPRLSKTGCTQGLWSNGAAANISSFTPTSTFTMTASWVCSTTDTIVATVTEASKPLPVWAAPILKQIPTLSKTLTTEGGKLSLKDGDYSSLKSVTVGGKEVAYSIDAKGDVNIPVPAGKGGTFADLVVTFTGGKMTVQDGIKYVEPTNVAAVREAPIAGFKGTSTKITGALAESIQYAAQLDKKANTVLCTGYAASKAAVATATARAEAACGYATKVNDQLVNKKVTIVVNAKLAKTASVGIKVYK